MIDPSTVEVAPGFSDLGIVAFTTTRALGDFSLSANAPVREVHGRWLGLAASLRASAGRLASAHQVHGVGVVEHGPGWSGLLRCPDADAHLATSVPTAMAVTLADCVPVFIAHPRGAAAVVHCGWKGTAARLAVRVIERLAELGFAPAALRVHCGPAVCGSCYEVGPDVHFLVTGRQVAAATPVDLRAIIAGQVGEAGVLDVTMSASCTRCDDARFFSHRRGDAGRHVGVIVSRGAT